MKFIADVMLGRLAKRLRLLGFDVLYDRTLNDNEIIRLSLEQDRVILTSDTGLAERPLAANHLLIKGNLGQKQVEQVLSIVPLEARLNPLTRCSECNISLSPLEKRDARDLVPPHVYETHDGFLHCTSCGRIYWKGSHVKRMALPAGVKIKQPVRAPGPAVQKTNERDQMK
jgi:uncharacterized protein with PIN domain